MSFVMISQKIYLTEGKDKCVAVGSVSPQNNTFSMEWDTEAGVIRVICKSYDVGFNVTVPEHVQLLKLSVSRRDTGRPVFQELAPDVLKTACTDEEKSVEASVAFQKPDTDVIPANIKF